MADIKSVLRKHRATKDHYQQQQPSEHIIHIFPQAQNVQLKQLWPLPAADQTLSAPNFAQLAAAALEPGTISSKTTHQQLAELLCMPQSHSVLLKQLWPLPSVDRTLSVHNFAQLAPAAFDNISENHLLFKGIRKMDFRDVTTLESRYAQSTPHSPDYDNQLNRVICNGQGVVFRTEAKQHQTEPDTQLPLKEEIVTLDNQQVVQAQNTEVKQAESPRHESSAVNNSAVIPQPSSHLPGCISKLLHSIFRCLVDFRRMINVPVRTTDFRGISTLASRYAQTGLLNALNFPFDYQLNCDICERKGVLSRTEIKQQQPGVTVLVDKQNIEQAYNAEVKQHATSLSADQTSYTESSISVLSASLEPADVSSDYEIVSMNDVEIIDDDWQIEQTQNAEPNQLSLLPDASTDQPCCHDDNSASVLPSLSDSSSMETVLVRDVEMLSEQQQQLNELLHILQAQNNQLRQLTPQLSPTAAADGDDRTSSVDEFDLMTVASRWSGDADSMLEYIERCVVEQSRRIADVTATASRQNAELKATCSQQQLS